MLTRNAGEKLPGRYVGVHAANQVKLCTALTPTPECGNIRIGKGTTTCVCNAKSTRDCTIYKRLYNAKSKRMDVFNEREAHPHNDSEIKPIYII